MTERCSIILLNFNGLADTLACLESLRKADLGDARVWVLDNGSDPAEAARLSHWNETTGFFKHRQDVKGYQAPSSRAHTLLTSKVNYGFAGGNNLVTRLALAEGDREVLLLNNDTVVATDFLVRLREGRARHPNAVLIPQIRLYDQPELIWNCGGALRWPGRKVYHYAGAPEAALSGIDDFSVTFVTGCVLLYAPETTGLLTERFFFGEEDMEFSWRLRQRKMPALCLPQSIVYHKVGASLPANHRKSEVFTLRRLVNLRLHLGPAEAAAGYLLYGISLLRLLLFRYRTGLGYALRSVGWVVWQSFKLDEVGHEYCVTYVVEGRLDSSSKTSKP